MSDRGRPGNRSRSRSESPSYRRPRSRDGPISKRPEQKKPAAEDKVEHMDQDGEEEEEDDETKMMKLMGFGGFDTTKNKKVPGADVSGAKIHKPIKYRQYMNRRGGFNR
ncbi:dihydrolipoamide dehydrogenase precursor [Mucor velutinosus]|uniref:Dihydrolipoamide dehydrogenase n=1 Tax=Mucor velutinosus TaxID=708070 RepID=A0AAN7DFR2_9FUNG|nr:dihydrolipoamide dehydrogenase precursor [Mucor velutinosus]